MNLNTYTYIYFYSVKYIAISLSGSWQRFFASKLYHFQEERIDNTYFYQSSMAANG